MGLFGLLAVLAVLIVVLFLRVVRLETDKKQDNITENAAVNAPSIEIYLPEVYYAASGLTMEIYNSQITNLGRHITDYDVFWECEVGECYERKFHVEASDENVGNYDLMVSVFAADGTLLAKRESVLSIVEAKSDPISILAIGDSLSANGALYWKLLEHLDGNLICNGTRAYEGFLTEARHGFSAGDYLQATPYTLGEGEACHPFYNLEKESFDWNYYKETTGFDPDLVWVFLGTNGLASGDGNADDIVKIVESIREDDRTVPIYVVNTIYQGSQNGIGAYKDKYGNGLLKSTYKQQRDLYTFQLMTYLEDALGEEKYVYLVPAAISVDSETVFEMEERSANPYSDLTESYEVDPIHPTKDGYYQIADTIYSTLCGTMEEWKK